MAWMDKLELGLKKDPPNRKDNLPARQIHGPEPPTGSGRSPEIPLTTVSGVQVATESGARPAPLEPRKTVRYRPGPAKRR
jgi:hypothetical protein